MAVKSNLLHLHQQKIFLKKVQPSVSIYPFKKNIIKKEDFHIFHSITVKLWPAFLYGSGASVSFMRPSISLGDLKL